jgi:hypothetical protein
MSHEDCKARLESLKRVNEDTYNKVRDELMRVNYSMVKSELGTGTCNKDAVIKCKMVDDEDIKPEENEVVVEGKSVRVTFYANETDGSREKPQENKEEEVTFKAGDKILVDLESNTCVMPVDIQTQAQMEAQRLIRMLCEDRAKEMTHFKKTNPTLHVLIEKALEDIRHKAIGDHKEASERKDMRVTEAYKNIDISEAAKQIVNTDAKEFTNILERISSHKPGDGPKWVTDGFAALNDSGHISQEETASCPIPSKDSVLGKMQEDYKTLRKEVDTLFERICDHNECSKKRIDILKELERLRKMIFEAQEGLDSFRGSNDVVALYEYVDYELENLKTLLGSRIAELEAQIDKLRDHSISTKESLVTTSEAATRNMLDHYKISKKLDELQEVDPSIDDKIEALKVQINTLEKGFNKSEVAHPVSAAYPYYPSPWELMHDHGIFYCSEEEVIEEYITAIKKVEEYNAVRKVKYGIDRRLSVPWEHIFSCTGKTFGGLDTAMDDFLKTQERLDKVMVGLFRSHKDVEDEIRAGLENEPSKEKMVASFSKLVKSHELYEEIKATLNEYRAESALGINEIEEKLNKLGNSDCQISADADSKIGKLSEQLYSFERDFKNALPDNVQDALANSPHLSAGNSPAGYNLFRKIEELVNDNKLDIVKLRDQLKDTERVVDLIEEDIASLLKLKSPEVNNRLDKVEESIANLESTIESTVNKISGALDVRASCPISPVGSSKAKPKATKKTKKKKGRLKRALKSLLCYGLNMIAVMFLIGFITRYAADFYYMLPASLENDKLAESILKNNFVYYARAVIVSLLSFGFIIGLTRYNESDKYNQMSFFVLILSIASIFIAPLTVCVIHNIDWIMTL